MTYRQARSRMCVYKAFPILHLLGSNTIPLLQHLRPEDIYPSFMPRPLPKNPSKSTIRRRRILASSCGDKIMRRCSNYVRRNSDCLVGPNSNSYTACTGSGLNCELAFSKAKLRCIQKKRREKLSSIVDAAAKIAHLKTEIDRLEQQEEELVRREL